MLLLALNKIRLKITATGFDCLFEYSDFDSGSVAPDYSGDHKNTREVYEFPRKLLLTVLQICQ